jgi:twinkle protein
MMKQYAPLLGVELNERNPAAFDYVADKFQELPLHFLKFYGSSPVQEVIEAMEYAVYVHDVQHIVLDNLQFMLSGQGRHNSDKFDLQDRAIEAFRQFASQRNVHISIVIHPRKEADNSSLGLASVFGSGKATQEADNVLIVQGGLPRTLTKSLGLEGKGKASNKPDMSQGGGFDDPITGEIMATFFRTLELRKNRWDGDLGAVPMRFDKSSARLYELTPEDAQTGLVDFVEKHRKLKQLDLLKHMSQHAPERASGFDGMPVDKSTKYVSRPPPQGPSVAQREWGAVPEGQIAAALGNVFPSMNSSQP